MNNYHLKSFSTNAPIREIIILALCIALTSVIQCAEPESAENPAHQLQPDYENEIPKGLPVRKNIVWQRSDCPPDAIPMPEKPYDSDDEKLHTTCWCITH